MKKYGFAGLFLITSLCLHASQEGQAVPRPSLAKRQAFNRQYTEIQESFMNFVAQSTCPRIVLISRDLYQANKDKDTSFHLKTVAQGIGDIQNCLIARDERRKQAVDDAFSLFMMNFEKEKRAQAGCEKKS